MVENVILIIKRDSYMKLIISNTNSIQNNRKSMADCILIYLARFVIVVAAATVVSSYISISFTYATWKMELHFRFHRKKTNNNKIYKPNIGK